jgi:hypothetical protein
VRAICPCLCNLGTCRAGRHPAFHAFRPRADAIKCGRLLLTSAWCLLPLPLPLPAKTGRLPSSHVDVATSFVAVPPLRNAMGCNVLE